jgi:hypothetical protein
MKKQLIKCSTDGCGYVAYLYPDGEAYDDCEPPCKLFKNDDGTFECLACGAPINVSPKKR